MPRFLWIQQGLPSAAFNIYRPLHPCILLLVEKRWCQVGHGAAVLMHWGRARGAARGAPMGLYWGSFLGAGHVVVGRREDIWLGEDLGLIYCVRVTTAYVLLAFLTWHNFLMRWWRGLMILNLDVSPSLWGHRLSKVTSSLRDRMHPQTILQFLTNLPPPTCSAPPHLFLHPQKIHMAWIIRIRSTMPK